MIWKITKMWRDKIKPRKQTVMRIVSQIYKIRVWKLTQSEKLLLANSQLRVSSIDSAENKPTDTSYMSKLKHWKITAAKHETNTFKLYLFFIHLFVVQWRAEEMINGRSYGLHRWTFVIRALFLPRRHVEKHVRQTFTSSFDVFPIGFKNLEPPGLASHFVTLR